MIGQNIYEHIIFFYVKPTNTQAWYVATTATVSSESQTAIP